MSRARRSAFHPLALALAMLATGAIVLRYHEHEWRTFNVADTLIAETLTRS